MKRVTGTIGSCAICHRDFIRPRHGQGLRTCRRPECTSALRSQNATRQGMERRRPREWQSAFWANVRVGGECWEWTGRRDPHGYGITRVPWTRSPQRAHRISAVIYFGWEPDCLLVCHRCDNPSCVNPDHLFLGSAADNALDRASKDRGHRPKGEGNGQSKLTDDLVRQIRQVAETGTVSQSELARRINVHQSLISKVVRGHIWTHVA